MNNEELALVQCLKTLVHTPSPTGFTDNIVHSICGRLEDMGVAYELTRRGAIRATVRGKASRPARAVVCHVDTLGAMVKELKPNGRLRIVPIGHWSSRFAENTRATVVTEDGSSFRGTILPIKASGHTYGDEIDELPISWDTVEMRVDVPAANADQLRGHGVDVGDFVMIDPGFEVTAQGYIVSRHLDDKAGVAVLLTALQRLVKHKEPLPTDCHILFTISEEVGSGASAVLHGDISEMVTLDNSTVAAGQNSNETGVTIAVMDSSGPFDYHLTKKLVELCRKERLNFSKDVFKYYRCDAASALEAGNDLRTAVACFGLDASHGVERTHLESLRQLTELVVAYLKSEPLFARDEQDLGPIEDFPGLPHIPAADLVVDQPEGDGQA